MPKPKTVSEAYQACLERGLVRDISEVNIEKVKSLIANAEININSATIIAKNISKEAKEWMNVFTLHYEALRIYAEALLLMEKIESPNHECLLATLCTQYPHLELEWNFLEGIRTKRHGVNYYGETITYQNWKSIEIQIKVYLQTLKKELKQKIEVIMK